ncbi:carboxypeptidase-like regulatory domain-containing protein [Flavitalea sp. BT771]|uniref:carboxypeptidase-like regulatory domain-containing protein n=1 Tax=Flavitalea sp. BT771 TaxID=3063329 RepID=UPI0026E34A80|nr:carboxypeptidase-like regulatory domain-containing protein [Flavitalea sp. BT771]MDO6430999.1 carboxypeptidase-like regulatory domain-containing protein [Flavitalea sp. BT771]MDV6219906.1 carboxypeptidase-like regulatory domain-containing protein [Flavitalea sp. BT771]
MSDKDKHIPTYTASDIEKYLSGELSAPEMHALERAALDDPFLADALDGIALHRRMPQQTVFSKDMAELRERLQERVKSREKGKPRVISLGMRYAAAVILLLGLGVTAYYMLSDKRMADASLAKTEHRPAAPVIHPDTTTTPAAATPAPKDTNTLAVNNTAPSAPVLKKSRQASSGNGIAADDKVKAEENTILGDVAVQAEAQTVAPSPSGKVVTADTIKLRWDTLSLASNHKYDRETWARQEKKAADVHAFSFDKTTAADQLVFSGKVTDVHNRPLPGAFLSLKNNANINATTDRNGYFNLRLNKMDTSSAVVVNYVGYEQASLALNPENTKSNIIQLQPQSASLNEVTIVGYGAKRKELLRQNIDAPQKALSTLAVPADGWPAYKTYLESNKSSVSLDSTLRGGETISFIVDRNGKLSSFKVEQSISPAHDSLVTRIVREGPAWRLLSGKKARARVILTY